MRAQTMKKTKAIQLQDIKMPGATQTRRKCPPTPGEPDGYIDRADWMERRYARGLVQKQCPKCKLWHLWAKKTVTKKTVKKAKR